MDLAVYINELLGLQGEVNVPGIGHFAQVRINGYYNEKENKFYPPAHKINFDPEYPNDESLAKYISEKKNISLASSKYFIEKYVIGLTQQLATSKVEIAGLGQIYTSGTSLGFSESANSKENDPAFFGFKPVEIPAAEKPAVNYAPPPVVEKEKVEEVVAPVPVIENTNNTELVNDRIPPAPPRPTVIDETEVPAEPEYEYEEPVQKNRNTTWIALLLIAIIALLTLMGLYKYKPDWFERPKDKGQTFVAVDTTQQADKRAVNADTTKKVATTQDSLAKATALVTGAAVDTDAVEHYEILGGAFKNIDQANGILKNYQKLGLQPRILKHVQGNSYKITLGTYFNKEQAQKAEDSISVATKLRKGPDIYLQIFKPKK
jgi:cell division protein FtsN